LPIQKDNGPVGTYNIHVYVNEIGYAIMQINESFTFNLNLLSIGPSIGGVGGELLKTQIKNILKLAFKSFTCRWNPFEHNRHWI
jgi:hypothetical protein